MTAAGFSHAWRLPAAIGASLVLIGCAGQGPEVVVRPVAAAHYAPTALVQVLEGLPRHPYAELAHMRADAPAGMSRAQLLAALQQAAGKLGADAIVVTRLSREGPPADSLRFAPSGGALQQVAVPRAWHAEALAIRLGAAGGNGP